MQQLRDTPAYRHALMTLATTRYFRVHDDGIELETSRNRNVKMQVLVLSEVGECFCQCDTTSDGIC